jgi:hypothetical protein
LYVYRQMWHEYWPCYRQFGQRAVSDLGGMAQRFRFESCHNRDLRILPITELSAVFSDRRQPCPRFVVLPWTLRDDERDRVIWGSRNGRCATVFDGHALFGQGYLRGSSAGPSGAVNYSLIRYPRGTVPAELGALSTGLGGCRLETGAPRRIARRSRRSLADRPGTGITCA